MPIASLFRDLKVPVSLSATRKKEKANELTDLSLETVFQTMPLPIVRQPNIDP